jgi:hypothetical protein
MFKIIIILISIITLAGCGMDIKQFNSKIANNEFIGIESVSSLKKLDKDAIEGLCNGLTESQMESRKNSNHNKILNKNMVCIVNKTNKGSKTNE